MHRVDRTELLLAGLNRRLTPEEEAHLRTLFASDPDGPAALDEELALNNLLRQVPDVPSSSNFTAQVLQLAAREQVIAGRRRDSFQWLSGWILTRWQPKAVFGALAISVGLFSYHEYQVSLREEVAHSVATLSTVAAVPPLELLQNFEAISRLSQIPQDEDIKKVDFELLAALK